MAWIYSNYRLKRYTRHINHTLYIHVYEFNSTSPICIFAHITQVVGKEPYVQCVGGLWSPETGILDSHEYMTHLQADAESNHATIITMCEVNSIIETNKAISMSGTIADDSDKRYKVITNQGDIYCDYIINAAGLHATQLAAKIIPLNPTIKATYHSNIPTVYYAKGNYFKLESSTSAVPATGSGSPFTHLVYPVPSSHAGLGIHATLDLSGHVRFGPDVEWIRGKNGQNYDSNDGYAYTTNDPAPSNYTVDTNRAIQFKEAIRKYYPNVIYETYGVLVPDYSGIRPKLIGPYTCNNTGTTTIGQNKTKLCRNLYDFVIEESELHGVKGVINLYGIESPGLTASMVRTL